MPGILNSYCWGKGDIYTFTFIDSYVMLTSVWWNSEQNFSL